MKIIVFFISILFLATCGSKTNSGTTPLTNIQKAQFADTVAAIGVAERASHSAHQSRDKLSKVAADSFPTDMIDRLKMCEFKTTSPSMESSPISSDPSQVMKSNFNVFLKVSGDKCPITLDLSTVGSYEMSQTFMKMDARFSYDYKVVDMQGFSIYVDVTALSVSGSMSLNSSKAAASGNADLSGDITSTKQGKLKFYARANLKGDSNPASGEAIIGIEYADHTVELKDVFTVVDTKEKHQFTLNGEIISEDEFDGYILKLGSLGVSSKQGVSGKSHTQPHP